MESWNHEVFHEVTGLDMQFVQDSHSRSTKNVLRDLHYQIQQPQGKLVHVVLSDSADFLYKTTDYYVPKHEHCILWNDPAIDIDWHIKGEPQLSAKDEGGLLLQQTEVFP